MDNRGKDSWNKGMLVGTKPKSEKRVKEPPPKKEDSGVHTVFGMEIDPKDMRGAAQQVEPIQPALPLGKCEKTALVPDAWTPEKSRKEPARPPRGFGSRKKQATGLGAKNESIGNMRNQRKTPLQQFDVRAFFDEHLHDIIDLEENRSGIREFEDAVKWDD